MSIEDLKARYAEPQTNGTPMETESQGSETEGKYYTTVVILFFYISIVCSAHKNLRVMALRH